MEVKSKVKRREKKNQGKIWKGGKGKTERYKMKGKRIRKELNEKRERILILNTLLGVTLQ